MALNGLSSLESEEYISRDDPCKTREEGATIFFLQNIPSAVMARISDMQSAQQVSLMDGATQTFVQRNSAKAREAFKYGVSGWENFADKEGNPIAPEFEQAMVGGESLKVMTEKVMNKIPLAIIREVGDAAFNKNSLTEPQRKKFEELSSVFDGSNSSTAPSAETSNNETEDATETQVAASTGKTRSKRTRS